MVSKSVEVITALNICVLSPCISQWRVPEKLALKFRNRKILCCQNWLEYPTSGKAFNSKYEILSYWSPSQKQNGSKTLFKFVSPYHRTKLAWKII